MNPLSLTKLVSFASSLILAVLVFSSTATACDCVGPTGKDAIRKGSVAFRGTVTNIEYLDEKQGRDEPRILVTFSVERVWSGDLAETFVLHTTENRWTCAGYYFEKDKEYLVVAHPNSEETEKRYEGAKNTFGTNICGSTLPIESAKVALAGLGEGKKPKP